MYINRKTKDYVKKSFDEAEVLDALEKECLENLQSLQMTWKSPCNPEDLEAMKNVCSP